MVMFYLADVATQSANANLLLVIVCIRRGEIIEVGSVIYVNH